MIILSKTQYENESDYDKLIDVLVEIGLPSLYFGKAAINIAKLVYHSVAEEHKKVCLATLEIAEKYLRGEATKEECRKVTDKLTNIWYPDNATNIVAYATNVAIYASDTVDYTDAVVHTTNTAVFASDAAFFATSFFADKVATTCGIVKQSIPWEVVCSFQIAKCFGKENDENFIQKITKDENLMNYATILLEDKNLRKNFEFLMKDYVNK